MKSGTCPWPLQPKLLRVLQEKEYERVGEVETRKADVRIIAATSVDLEAAVKAGQFPRGPVLSPECGGDYRAAPAGTPGGYPAPGGASSGLFRPAKPSQHVWVSPTRPRRPCSITLGPATSGNCVMSSSGPSCFPRVKPSAWRICRCIWRPTPTEPQVGDLVSLESIEENAYPPGAGGHEVPGRGGQGPGDGPRHPLAPAEKIWGLTPAFHFAI